MKPSDITHLVMNQVVRFEEQRTKRWLTVFAVSVLLLIVIAGLFLYRSYSLISERHTLDMLEILYQDREIISEFWQDTISVVLTELPQKTLLLGSAALLFLGIAWIITRHRRQVVRRRLAELAKRKKSSNNT